MAMARRLPIAAAITLLFLALLPCLQLAEAQIGVCYGKAGNNLPPAQDVVNLYKQYGIGAMRIYDLDEAILQAVQGSGIELIIGVPNANIQSVGSDPSAATQFVQRYVVPYASSIRYIAVGNEVSMDSPQAPFVGPAMQNVLNALNAANLGGQIKVTTAISTSLVVNSYPPSNGQFSNMGFMGPVTNFLVTNGSPLLLNIYTYFSPNLDLNYRLFTSPGTVFTDPNNGLQYQNLFDALMDATYAALSKAGAPGSVTQGNDDAPRIKMVGSESEWALGGGRQDYNHANVLLGAPRIKIVGSESGWASRKGFGGQVRYSNVGDDASLDNAGTYYRNLIEHVKKGTPLKPGPMEMYLFEMFDENNKPGDPEEQHFGLFTPDETPKYQLNFN